MSKLLKNLITAFCIVVLLGIVYFFTIGKASEESFETVDTPNSVVSSDDVSLRTQKILADIREINTYTMDDSIFGDKRFNSLRDYRVEIKDVKTGRENPFQPVN